MPSKDPPATDGWHRTHDGVPEWVPDADPRAAVGRVRRLAAHGSLFLGIVAVCKGLIALSLLAVPFDPVLLLIGFLGAVTIYTHNKVTDLEEDAVNCPDRASFVESRAGTLVALSGATYLLALALSFRGGLDGLLVALVPGIAAVLYSESWLPVTDVDRLKEVPVVNTAVVAAAWAVPLTYLPVAFGEVAAGPTAAAVALFVFLRTFVAGEVMNVRDVDGDRAEGIATLPVVFGVARTRFALYALDVASALMIALAALAGLVPTVAAVALLAVFPYSFAITTALGRAIDHGRLGAAKDCEYLLMAVAVVAAGGLGGIGGL